MKATTYFSALIFSFLLFQPTISASRYSPDGPLLIAILEFTGNYSDTTIIDPSRPSVNFVFEREATKWNMSGSIAVTDYEWTVAFEGTTLGKLHSVHEHKRPRSSISVVDSSSQIPKVGQPSTEFAVWSSTSPAFRPLALVSRPNYEDPDKWKVFKPPSEEVLSLIPYFRKQVRTVGVCDKANPQKALPEKLRYPDVWINFIKAYRSTRGDSIFGYELDAVHNYCGDSRDSNWSPHWFFVHEGQIRFIGNEMRPLDAGDYDRDGKSEFIFQVSRYNTYGYMLFYDNFSRFVKSGIR